MPEMTLYGFNGSTYVRTLKMLLAEKKFSDFKQVPLNVLTGEPRQPAFSLRAVTPIDASRTEVINIDLRRTDVGFATGMIDHFNIAKIPGVQEMVLAEIKKTCPPRRSAQSSPQTAVR